MKALNLLVIVFVFYLTPGIKAQEAVAPVTSAINRDDNAEIMNQFYKGMIRNIDNIDDYEGTPFLDEDFTSGILYFPNNDPITAEIRYNVVKEEIQVLFDEDNYRVIHDGINVQIGKDLYKKYSYRGKDKSLSLLGYFKILTDDFQERELILLEKPYKKVKRGKAAAAMQKATPPKYLDKSDYYLKFSDSNSAVKVERKRKNFIKAFPEEFQEELESYMKENKLKSRKEQDLKNMVNYYNTNFQV